MTPAEDVAFLKALAARALDAAVPVAGAMGKTYKTHLKDVTLIESGSHGQATEAGYPPSAAPGSAPMEMTGHLRQSVDMYGPTGGGGIGRADVSPDTIYASTIQWGGVHHPVNGPYMWLWIRYVGYITVLRKNWLRQEVTIESRPYMTIAVAETVASGELQGAAEVAFEAAVYG
jgi:hypothetical protein